MVSDASSVDRVWLENARRQLTALGERIEVTYLQDLKLEDILTKVAALPNETVAVTVHDDAELAARGYAAGALAFVLKSAADELLPAVRSAIRDERYVSPPVRDTPA